MVIAARLGFHILKVNDLIGCAVLRRLIPVAEKLGLWIGVELHRPNTIHNSRWQPYFQLFEDDKGAHVGVVPDTGIFLANPHHSPTPVADFEVMLRYSRYMHGKFFFIDENLQDHSIDFKTIVAVMKRCGFHGYICAEYEGYFHDIALDGMEQLVRYRRMMQEIILDGGDAAQPGAV